MGNDSLHNSRDSGYLLCGTRQKWRGVQVPATAWAVDYRDSPAISGNILKIYLDIKAYQDISLRSLGV